MNDQDAWKKIREQVLAKTGCDCPLCVTTYARNRVAAPQFPGGDQGTHLRAAMKAMQLGVFQVGVQHQRDVLDKLNQLQAMSRRRGGGLGALTGLPASSSDTPWSDDLELSFDTEPIVGWRAWRTFNLNAMYYASPTPIEPVLRSAVVNEMWPPKQRMESRCEHDLHFGEDIPGHDCACGIWAMRDRDELIRRRVLRPAIRIAPETSTLWVIGKVALWGRVLEFEHGWRGRYAYPLSLEVLIPDTGYTADTQAYLDELEERYGVPVASSPQRYWVPDDPQVVAFQKALDDMQKQIAVSLAPAVQGMARGLADAQKQFDQTMKALGKDVRVVSMGYSPLWRKQRRRRYWTTLSRNVGLSWLVMGTLEETVVPAPTTGFIMLGLAGVLLIIWQWLKATNL